MRYGARDPWLAGWFRACIYLIWRFMVALVRPLILVGLLAGCVFFSWRAIDRSFVEIPAQAGPSETVNLAIQARLGGRGYDAWQDSIHQALVPSARNLPDPDLAASLARSLIAFAGAESLAKSILLEPGMRPGVVEADWRAIPSWQRDLQIQSSLDARFDEARALGLDPVELIFAEPFLRGRLAQSEALYGATLGATESWFTDPQGRSLTLSAVPGLAGGPDGGVLYDDVRDVVVQFCALVEASGQRMGPCRIGFLPKPRGDLIHAAAGLAMGVVPGSSKTGARIVKAASRVGTINSSYWSDILLGEDHNLGREAAMASAMVMLGDAGNVFAQADRYGDLLVSVGAEHSRSANIDIDRRDWALGAVSDIAREQGAVSTVRLLAVIGSDEDLETLSVLSRDNPAQLLGLYHVLGSDLVTIARQDSFVRVPLSDWPYEAKRDGALAVFLLTLAIALIGLVLSAGYRHRKTGAFSLYERVDRNMTLLILGRNS